MMYKNKEFAQVVTQDLSFQEMIACEDAEMGRKIHLKHVMTEIQVMEMDAPQHAK